LNAKRKLDYNVANKEVNIKSETDAGAGKNKFELNYKVNDPKLEITLRAYAKDTDSAAKFRFKWKIRGVVEYVETNGQEGYQEGADTRGTVWGFRDADWTFRTLPDTMSGSDTVKHFEGRSADGFFVLTGHISGGAFTTAGQMVNPVATKFDIAINPAAGGFAYTLAGSKLALIGWVMSSNQIKVKEVNTDGSETSTPSSNAKEVLFGPDASPEAFFSWATSASGNTTSGIAPCAIIASPLRDDLNETKENSDDNNKKTSHAFNCVQPRSLVWDPMVGLSGGVGTVVPSLTLILLAMVAAILNFLS
jgi:hypothetical protein